MSKPVIKNLENKLAVALLLIIYAGFMLGAYIVLDYIIQGKFIKLAMGVDKALVYLNNASTVVMVIVIIFVIIVNTFIVLLVINGIKDWKRKRNKENQ